MNNLHKFQIRWGEPLLEKFAHPPEDVLGELSHFEMGIRRFCYESDRPISIKIGKEQVKVFLDPDISMLLEEDLPTQIDQLSRGEKIHLEFVESCCVTIELVPLDNKVNCNLGYFGYSDSNKNFSLGSSYKQFQLDRKEVLETLTDFCIKIADMATETGYITRQERDDFISPVEIHKISS
ncbi:hypothetical protein [Okeania sp. SIO1I7]|uniref:hypothetical protein n=1 Tax=Okeania sp. SIO1I7 TaxID=2607772 RepID=UPI0013F6AEE7|nr:hypothetical protein [Okeania sp. SIO1I7]NET29077.1 hypothetical protein [Okeania sp. SIO1I7]